MNRADCYLPEAVTLYRRTGRTTRGEPTYDSGSIIMVRWESDRRLIRTSAGDETVSEARVFTTAEVIAGDELARADGVRHPALRADAIRDIDGARDHTEVRL